MPAWTLRPGTASDVAAMHALDILCFDAPFRFSLRAMREFTLAQGAVVWLAETPAPASLEADSPTTLAGFIIVHTTCRQGYLVTLDVAPSFRHQGLARALLNQSQALLNSITLHVFANNAAAIGFYEREGFERGAAEPDFYGDGLDAYVYRKLLASEAPQTTS